MCKIEFISYNGSWPALCCGELIMRINGEVVNLGVCLSSGGSCIYNGEDEEIYDGPWTIWDLDDKFLPFKEEIENEVNTNVAWGCCGGCL